MSPLLLGCFLLAAIIFVQQYQISYLKGQEKFWSDSWSETQGPFEKHLLAHPEPRQRKLEKAYRAQLKRQYKQWYKPISKRAWVSTAYDQVWEANDIPAQYREATRPRQRKLLALAKEKRLTLPQLP